MPTPSLLSALFGGAAVVALVAADALPALHGVPLFVVLLAGALQIGRELAGALAQRRIYPSTPVMNFTSAIVILHVGYFAGFARTGRYSTLLELLSTIVVAMFCLVFMAAALTDIKDPGERAPDEAEGHRAPERRLRHGLRDLALSLLIPLLVAGGLSMAFWITVPYWDGGRPVDGSLLAATVLAAAWLGMGVARRVAAGAPPWRPTPAADGVRLLVSALAMVGGVAALDLVAALPLGHAAGLGVVIGLATALGDRVVYALARFCDVAAFRYDLPHQVAMLQPLYNRLFAGGAVEYALPLVPVAPLVLLYLRGVVGP